MDGKIVKLLDPIEVYETKYAEIPLREPRGDLFSRLGAPRIPVVNQTAASGYWVDRDDVIREYLKALIEIDEFHVEALLKKMSLTDSIRMREALFGFFETAAARAAASRPEPSASASDS